MDELLGGPVDPNLVEVVNQRAQGNPYFVAELTRSLADTGQVEWVDGAWRLDRSRGEPRLPDSITGAVGATIDRLPQDEKLTLLLAAYAAYHRLFYAAPIRRMGRACGLNLDVALAALVERGLISEETPYTLGAWGIVPDTRAFSFATVLLREVAHDMVPLRERADLHLTFADWLREVTDLLPDTRSLVGQIEAGHLFEAWRLRTTRGEADADLGGRALAACLASARSREQLGAWREVVVDLGRAEAIARRIDPDQAAEIAQRIEAAGRAADALHAEMLAADGATDAREADRRLPD